MAKIARLPLHVANQIAAGEVIERPASVVKELVENALDAGARRITVEVTEGGRHLRVVDDGEGMAPDDAVAAFERFATSKLRDAEALWALTTMGFRGEALASIASIARVECLTRPRGGDRGTRVWIEGGSEPAVKPAGCPEGTAITVADLFYNTPARLKFLRAAATEQGHIHDVVLGLALCHPEVGFRLTINGREALSTVGAGALPAVVAALFGADAEADMVGVDHAGAGGRVWGLASRPDRPRGDRSRQFFFVNRRWVRHPVLARALEEAYGGHQPPGRHASWVLFLEVDPAAVDVNVHPAKKEVRLGQTQRVYLTLVDALRKGFAQAWTEADYAPAPPEGSAPAEAPTRWGGAGGWGALPERATTSAAEAAAAMAFWAPLPPLEGDQPAADGGPHAPAGGLPQGLPPACFPEGPGLPRELDGLRVLFQLQRTYIVCEHPEGLFLIDQHNSHERWLYEQLRPAGVVSQALLMPLVLPLSPREAGLAEEFGPRLAALGFDLEPFGEGRWILRGIPALLPLDAAEGTVRELLSGAERTGVVVRQPDDDPIRRTIACHAAVRAGDPLSMAQMEEVVARLRETRHPLTCPHGRPTGILISMQELARRCLRA
ncbi:MAG: DNA mismatch repair endonuclease MutL [Candidatus Sericytochromatia bacterium]|nr:DNA mismatch repair endonuclease MutL [Candidatus Sericytochromatia bacterium]